MSSRAASLEGTTVSTWLDGLHMECYKKYLGDYETVAVSLVAGSSCEMVATCLAVCRESLYTR